ncbi:MAG TPA: YetF domain-containing protein [Telluria sp.]|nr:YetF domain-containing protein [Telluria sp.]
MLELSLPWWEFMVRGTVVFCVLLLMVRVSGRRTVGQFTPFDLLVVMLLSEAVSNSLSGGDQSVLGGLIIAGTLVALNMFASYLTSHSKKMSDLLDGSPVLLGRDGKMFDQVLKKYRLSETEVTEALHEADCKLEDMSYAFLEADGNITIQQEKKD